MSDLLMIYKLQQNLDNYILAKLDGESWLIPKARMNCRQHLTMKFKLYTIDLVTGLIIPVVRNLIGFEVEDNSCVCCCGNNQCIPEYCPHGIPYPGMGYVCMPSEKACTNSKPVPPPGPSPEPSPVPTPKPTPMPCNYAITNKACMAATCNPVFGVGPSADTFSQCFWDNSTCCCDSLKQNNLCPTPVPTPPSKIKDPAIAAIEAKFDSKQLTNIFKLAELNGSSCSIPSQDVLSGAWSKTCYTWEALSDAIYIYNKYILTSGIYAKIYLPADYSPTGKIMWQYILPQKFLDPPEDILNNLKIISAFMASVWQESNNYKSCRELAGGKYADPTCRYGYGEVSGALVGPYCGSDGNLNQHGKDTMEAARCETLQGAKTGDDCYFGRGSIQTTWPINYLNTYNYLKNFKMDLADLNLLGLTYDDIDVFKYPDNVCKSGSFAFLNGLISALSMCPNKDIILGTEQSRVGVGCTVIINNGSPYDCSGAKPDCIGCRFSGRCVGGGGAGSGEDPNSQRSQAYIEFIDALGLS